MTTVVLGRWCDFRSCWVPQRFAPVAVVPVVAVSVVAFAAAFAAAFAVAFAAAFAAAWQTEGTATDFFRSVGSP